MSVPGGLPAGVGSEDCEIVGEGCERRVGG